jgi:Uma2 family endonuclease
MTQAIQPASSPLPMQAQRRGVPRFASLRPFSVDEYHRLVKAGVLTEEDNVELIEGWVVNKVARNPPHDVSLGLTSDALAGLLPSGWHLREQSAITTQDSEPEPDLAVVRGNRRDFVSAHPEAADLALVVEVAESSITQDREDKGPMYARAGIPVYWIVNLNNDRIEVYTDPTGDDPAPAYRQRQDFNRGDGIPFSLPGHVTSKIPVASLLP